MRYLILLVALLSAGCDTSHHYNQHTSPPPPPVMTLDVSPGGTVAIVGDQRDANGRGYVIFEATAEPGWRIYEWEGNGMPTTFYAIYVHVDVVVTVTFLPVLNG